MKKGPREQLTSWLDRQLEILPPGAALPTDRELASRFGLSRRTISRIGRNYVRDGRILRISGKGTFVPKDATDDDSLWSASSTNAAQSLVGTIHDLIRSGELERGHSLPSIKYMRRRFKVSPATVTAAYRQLVDEGYVTKIGKSFWIGRFKELAHPDTKKEVFLFLHGPRDFSHVFKRDFLSQAYRKLQAELGFYGFVLRCKSCYDLDRLVSGWTSTRRLPYGIVAFGVDERNAEAMLTPINRLLADKRVQHPPVVIDWVWGMPSAMPRGAMVLSRPNMLTSSARALAHYAVERHWRRIVICSTERGLRPGTRWHIYDWMRLRSELKRIDPDFEFRILVLPARSGGTTRPVLSWVHEPVASRVLSKYTGTSYAQVSTEISAVNDLRMAVRQIPRRTLLVFRKDAAAAGVLSLLQEDARRVPEDIGVMGVENDPAHYHLGISCCEPDWDSAGYLMAHTIVGDFPVKKTHRGFMRVPARVNERLTT
ncbi:MAG: GntR family transcriptional regulator [Chitinivibrionales bacterium]|nr:GntR family transcriptional regulator [Chitinivibrionales bacterium]MBD3395885.1 GntR family transcriptional regulator [Chitinivibrionales bacterium]